MPGTPGAEWSEEEVLIVKSKLYATFNKDFMPWSEGAARALRLGFHDCLKYKDGTGGCDGCLNWKGVGKRYNANLKDFRYDNVVFGDNNGLEQYVEFLEKIYKYRRYPLVSRLINF